VSPLKTSFHVVVTVPCPYTGPFEVMIEIRKGRELIAFNNTTVGAEVRH